MRTESVNYEAKLQANIKQSNLKKALAVCADNDMQEIMFKYESNAATKKVSERFHPASIKTNVTMDVVEFLSDYINWVYVSRYVPMTKKFINAHIEDLNIYAMLTYNPHIDEGWVREVLNGVNNEIRETVIENIFSLFFNGVIDSHTLIKYGSESDISIMSDMEKKYKNTDFGSYIKWR